MRRRMRAAAVAFGLTAGAAPGWAQVSDADFAAETFGSLAALCGAAAEDPRFEVAIGLCLGWIEGAGQFYEQMVSDPRFGLDPVACPAGEISREDVRSVIVSWAADNPDAAPDPALLGVMNAVGAAYPCE